MSKSLIDKARSRREYSRKFKTPSEIVDILEQERGLLIHDRDEAEFWIRRVGYFHLKGYLDCLKDPDSRNKFRKGSSFEHVIQLILWERRLRSLLLEQIGKLELALRSEIVQEVGQGSGNRYLDESIFDVQKLRNSNSGRRVHGQDTNRWKAWQFHLNSILKNFLEDKGLKFAKKFQQGEDSPQIPLWILVERMSFGEVVDFYQYLQRVHREAIAMQFANPESIGGELRADEFFRILDSVKQLRNAASHLHVFFDKDFSFRKLASERSKIAGDPYFPNIGKPRSLYEMILLMLFLAPSLQVEPQWPESMKELLHDFPSRIPGVNVSVIGAEKDWHRFAPWTSRLRVSIPEHGNGGGVNRDRRSPPRR